MHHATASKMLLLLNYLLGTAPHKVSWAHNGRVWSYTSTAAATSLSCVQQSVALLSTGGVCSARCMEGGECTCSRGAGARSTKRLQQIHCQTGAHQVIILAT